MPRLILSSKGQAAGIAISLALAGVATGEVPYSHALAAVVAVVVVYIAGTALEDHRKGAA